MGYIYTADISHVRPLTSIEHIDFNRNRHKPLDSEHCISSDPNLFPNSSFDMWYQEI